MSTVLAGDLDVRRLSANAGDAAALAALALAAAAAVALVGPLADVPIVDDWTYAWSVEHLLKTGQFRVLDWSAHYPVVQVLWGAAVARVVGFSFDALRVSTLLLAWAGVCALYLILRTARLDRVTSVLGAALLLFNPVFFVLAHSFMTDVPFVSLTLLALLASVRWIRRGDASGLAVWTLLATATFLVRQLAVGLLLAAVPVVRTRRAWPARLILGLGVPAAAIVAAWWTVRSALGVTSAYAMKSMAVELALTPSWWLSAGTWAMYTAVLLEIVLHLGVVFAPLAVSVLFHSSRRTVTVAAAIVLVMLSAVLVADGAIPRVLVGGQTLSVDELGAGRPLLRGEPSGREGRASLSAIATAVGLAGALGIIAAGVEAVRRRRLGDMGGVLMSATAAQLVLAEVLWLYYDRYYLPLVPGVIYLLATAMTPKGRDRALAVLTVAVLALVSVTGTIDNLRFSRAVATAHRSLLKDGVPAWHVDAGYALNGWWLYAHPENLGPGMRAASDVPFVTATTAMPYVVANSPLPGYEVLRAVSWVSWWATSDTVHVLRRGAETAQHPSDPCGTSNTVC